MRPHESHSAPVIPSKVNAYSLMLSAEESEQVFKMLGRKCQTLNTAVVQIYETEASAHSHWKKRHTGVICFVKDSAIRSYFLRAYCLLKHELIWEHELYESMRINKDRPFLLTFEGQNGYVGLNFVSEEECDSFYGAVNLRIEMRNRKKLEKRNRMKSQLAPSAPLTPLPKEPVNNVSSTVQLRNHPKINSFTPTPAPTAPSAVSATKSFFFSSKEKKRKVTKADISQPTNFLHVSHVGWNADKGFDLTGNENDEVLSQFFAKAGVSETELKDRDTRAFIYDFIQSNNVLRKVKSEQEEKPVKNTTTITAIKVDAPLPPPPVPNRFQQPVNGVTLSQRTAPPPPLARKQQAETAAHPVHPANVSGQSKAAPVPPTRPPPINSMAAPPPPVPPPPPSASASPALIIPPPPPPAMPAPPPPPPPPAISFADEVQSKEAEVSEAAVLEPKVTSSLPVVSDSRNDLLESIRKGVQLRKIDVSALSTSSGDSHSDLMSEIRSGIELKPTQNRELAPNRDSDEFSGTDALANALRRALQERGRVIQSSDDESESSVNDEEWDD